MGKRCQRISFCLLSCLFFVVACGLKDSPIPPGKNLPATPQGLSAWPTPLGFLLSWEILGEVPAGFRVFRAPMVETDCKTCSPAYTLRAVLGPEARSFEDRADSGQLFLYEVRGFLAGGAEGPAASVTISKEGGEEP